MTTQHGSGRFVLKEGGGIILKQARLRAELHRYQLGEMLGFTNRRSGQDFVMRMEKGEIGPAAISHVMSACAMLGVAFDAVARWERIA